MAPVIDQRRLHPSLRTISSTDIPAAPFVPELTPVVDPQGGWLMTRAWLDWARRVTRMLGSLVDIITSVITDLIPNLANIAYTNVRNTFTESQVIAKPSGPRLQLYETAQAANDRKWELMVFGSELYLHTLADDETSLFVPLRLQRDGDAYLAADLYLGKHFYNIGAIYPGRVDIVSNQTSWYLGSHASYGLWTNTGMHFGGGVTITAGGMAVTGQINANTGVVVTGGVTISNGLTVYANGAGIEGQVYASEGFKERSRTVKLGEWTAYTPTVTCNIGTISGGTANASWNVIGNMLTIQFALSTWTITGGPSEVYFTLPSGYTVGASAGSTNCSNPVSVYSGAWVMGLGYSAAGAVVYRINFAFGAFAHLWGTAIIPLT
jgi:hypothetical protein